MGNVGWQDWSEFGEVEIGIDNTQNPVSLTNPLSFDDTWHVIDVDKRSTLPPALGGRGNLVGWYDQTLSVMLTVYGNWAL
jgi:hypothetical protein